jgi:hypothetical protein
MKYVSVIAREAASLPLEKQAEVLEFINFLKTKQRCKKVVSASMTVEEIKTFFASFNVDTSNFKFSRDEANTR